MQPIERFDLDAAIIFSDILVIPQALGMEIVMKPKEGPVFTEPLQEPAEIDQKLNLTVDVRKELKYVYDAITLTRSRLNGRVPLIGFSGAPWTLFAYMIEGGTSKTQSKAKKWLYKHESESLRLLNCLTDLIIVYLIEQIRAGAQLVQIFESHLGYLTPDLFSKFSLPFLQRIVQQVRAGLRATNIDLVPIIFYGKDGDHFAIEQLAKGENYFDVISVDWTMSPRFARQLVGEDVTLQGNLDPCALYSEPAKLDRLVKEMIDRFGKEKHIANLGHGIYPGKRRRFQVSSKPGSPLFLRPFLPFPQTWTRNRSKCSSMPYINTPESELPNAVCCPAR